MLDILVNDLKTFISNESIGCNIIYIVLISIFYAYKYCIARRDDTTILGMWYATVIASLITGTIYMANVIIWPFYVLIGIVVFMATISYK